MLALSAARTTSICGVRGAEAESGWNRVEKEKEKGEEQTQEGVGTVAASVTVSYPILLPRMGNSALTSLTLHLLNSGLKN